MTRNVSRDESPAPLIVEMRPARNIERYEVLLGGQIILASSRVPGLDACRALIATGYDPATPLHVYRGDVLSLRIRSIGEGAKLTVGEGDKRAPHFRRYEAFSRERVRPPIEPDGGPAVGERSARHVGVVSGVSE